MTQPHILKTLLEHGRHPDLLLFALYIQHTQGWDQPQRWEPRSPYEPAVSRDSSRDYDQQKQARIQAAQEARRGSMAHRQRELEIKMENVKYGR